MEELPWIYGAATAATRSEAVARSATERAVREAPAGADRRLLVAEAVRHAVRAWPAAPFDRLDPDDGQALALVRLAGLSVDEVSALTGEEPAAVKRRLTGALRALSRAPLAA